MRIVQIEDFFHPKAGYQVNIISKYFAKAGNEVFVVTAELEGHNPTLVSFFGKDNIEKDDAEYEAKYGVKIIRIPIKKYISGRVIYDKSLYKTIDDLKPDILYVHGNDTFVGMRYIYKSSRLKYPLISDSHMLKMASQNKMSKIYHLFYKMFITPKIKKNNITIIRTQDDDYVEKYLGIPLSNCPWISFGSDIMLFHKDDEAKKSFRKENKIDSDALVFVYAGKLDEAKGGLFLAESLVDPFDTKRKCVFLVVGNTSKDEYGQKIEALFKQSSNTIYRFPTKKYEELASVYQVSDVALFPKQCSLSFFDVQACSLPVISEDNSVNVDRCSFDNGCCFKSGDVKDFREKISFFGNIDNDSLNKMRVNSLKLILENYNYDTISQHYVDEINKTIVNFNKRRQKNG